MIWRENRTNLFFIKKNNHPVENEKAFLRVYGNITSLLVFVIAVGLSVSLGSLMYITGEFSLHNFPEPKSLILTFLLNFFLPYFLLASIVCVLLATTGKARFASMLAFSAALVSLVSITIESIVFLVS